MLRKLILTALAVATLGIGGAVATVTPAAAQSFYFGFDDGPRRYHSPPRHHRHWGPPPRYYRDDYRHRRPRHCERVRVRFYDGYGWRVRTERRCYR
jgi:hypothetical protein